MTAATAPAPRRSRRLLVPLATLLAATGIAVASGASFTTTTSSTGLVASGTLRQLNSNTVAFDRSNLKPGDTVTGAVTITNNGSLPAAFTLKETGLTNTFVNPALVTLSVKETAGTVTKTFPTSTLGTTPVLDLGTFGVNEARTYTFTVAFSSAAANAEQGRSATTRYTFDSVSTAGESLVATQNGTATQTERTDGPQ